MRFHPLATWHHNGIDIELKTPDKQLVLDPAAHELLSHLDSWWTPTPEFQQDCEELKQFGVAINRSEWNSKLDVISRVSAFLNEFGENKLTLGRRPDSEEGIPQLPQDEHAYVGSIDFQDWGTIWGSGMDRDPETAVLKVIAEIYERISCDARFNADLVGHTPQHETFTHSILKYETWQLNDPEFPFTEEPSGLWTTATSPAGKEAVSVPMELVYYPARLQGQQIGETSSCGVAAHPDIETAQLSSVYELIERDAFMVHWFGNISRPRLRPPDILGERIEELQRHGFNVAFVDLSLDTAPVVMAVCHRDDPDARPRLALGLAAGPDPNAVMAKALSEAQLWVLANANERMQQTPDDARAIRQASDHLAWYDDPSKHGHLLQMIESRSIDADEITSGPTTVAEMHERLQQHSYEWYTVEVNVAGAARTGMHVVRSFVPGLVPMQFGYMREPLGMLRLTKPPVVNISNPRTDSVSYIPHPFP